MKPITVQAIRRLFQARDLAFARFLITGETDQGWERFRRVRNWINRRPVMRSRLAKQIRSVRLIEAVYGNDHGLAYPNGNPIPRWRDLN